MKLNISRLNSNDVGRAHANCSLFWDMSAADINLKDYLSDKNCILLVAEVGGEPSGQIVGHILKRWDSKKPLLFLYSIDVVESQRRKGIARKLIEEFLRIGRESGCGKSFVFTNESNIPAMETYRALGGTRANIDDVMFEWK